MSQRWSWARVVLPVPCPEYTALCTLPVLHPATLLGRVIPLVQEQEEYTGQS